MDLTALGKVCHLKYFTHSHSALNITLLNVYISFKKKKKRISGKKANVSQSWSIVSTHGPLHSVLSMSFLKHFPDNILLILAYIVRRTCKIPEKTLSDRPLVFISYVEWCSEGLASLR